MMIQRPFSSGSRQAPDPHDNFLEQAGFYRKHTARDPSCLFRTISEQMYDTQNHHLTIRETCVSYMRKNKLYFQKSLKQYIFDVDIDEYLDELSKLKTFGTLLELEAMAHMFARNVILFRPLELGYCFFYNPNFDKSFQVFVSHDRHFDTVYKNNFIEDAAFCQSIVYELLYKHVFKLPDITYAVERMLHATSFEEIGSTNDGTYCRQIFLKDGRTFELDTPEGTDCILNNYELCHFHNLNFPQMAEMLQNEVNKFDPSYSGDTKIITSTEYWPPCGNHPSYFYPNNSENVINDNGYYDCNSRLKQLDSLLPEKYVSCVRQLLYEGITPFPYKVAKALDPDMYRNIEFDSWSEVRKEQRWKNWYTGGNNLQMVSGIKNSETKVCMMNYLLQVGVKCQVYLRKQDAFYTGYIQEMPDTQNGPCVVFIEDLGEKRTVSYDCLKPLPPDQVKPWPLPYRWQKQFEKYQQQQNQMYSPAKFFKRFSNHQSKCKMFEFDSYEIMHSYPLDQHIREKDDINLKLKQYCSLDNFTPNIVKPIEIITLPLSVENDRTPLSSNVQMNQNKISEQTPLNAGISQSNKTDEIPSRTSSTQQSQQQQEEEQEIIESTYLDENNMVLQSNSTIALPGSNDGSCQYPMYNYYTEPYYAYHPFDSSIIATGGGQQYFCVVPNATSNVQLQHGGQPTGVFMQSGHPLSPTLPCASAGAINNHIASLGYYPAPGTQTYFPTSTVLQPIISQPISSSRQMANNNNINLAVQKSVMESGIDLPHDIATLRFFFNLGWDYYNEINGGKNKDSENITSRLAIDFQNIKVENENSNQDKADSNNNNIVTSNNSVSESSNNDQYCSNQNSSQNNGNNNNYSTRSNNSKYNNVTNHNNNNHHHNNNNQSNCHNNNNRAAENKHFSSRYFNNRKTGNYNRGNGMGHNNRYMQGSQNARSNNGTNSHNSRNDNRSVNVNSGSKGGTGVHKNEPYQKVNNINNNNNSTNEPDSSNITDLNCGNKNKETLETGNQTSPISTTSDNIISNQASASQQRALQSVATSSASYTVPYYTDHSNSCGNEQFTTVALGNGSGANGNIFVPQVITPVPFGICQTVPPPNVGTPSYNSVQHNNVSHNPNYSYFTSGQPGPINTSHPPPPLPTAAPPQSGGISMQPTATYSMQTPHLQQQTYYYPFATQPLPPSATGAINSAVSETSTTSSVGGGLGEVNMMNYTPESTAPYPFMNFPVYYTPTNNGGLTPTGNNSNIHTGGSVNGNTYQGYWFTPTPVPSQVTIATPTSNNKIH